MRHAEALGYRGDVAGNGREALRAPRRSNYDLILMDCQMPEMDGFEATRAIRLDEARQPVEAGRSPSAALTANALNGDREKCLAAGMDDYLSKPFTREQLGAILSHWLDQKRTPSPEPSPEPRREPDQVLDPKTLEELRGFGAPGVLERVASLYLDKNSGPAEAAA